MGELDSTWKIAAAVLGVSVDTAQRQWKASRNTGDPMPILQIGNRGRIRFDEKELRAWQRLHPKGVNTKIK